MKQATSDQITPKNETRSFFIFLTLNIISSEISFGGEIKNFQTTILSTEREYYFFLNLADIDVDFIETVLMNLMEFNFEDTQFPTMDRHFLTSAICHLLNHNDNYQQKICR